MRSRYELREYLAEHHPEDLEFFETVLAGNSRWGVRPSSAACPTVILAIAPFRSPVGAIGLKLEEFMGPDMRPGRHCADMGNVSGSGRSEADT